MRIIGAILLLSVLLSGCGRALPLTQGQARATAVAGGCWPYGVNQARPTPPAATATPRLNSPDAPPTATAGMAAPSATAMPVYPTCTPAPLTPTVTPMPTVTPHPFIPATPQPPAAITAPQELQDATGVVRESGLAWAWNPRARGPVIAWIAFGWRPDEATDGQVWVRAQDSRGNWATAQTVNTTPVIRTYGGVAVGADADGRLRLLYGSGDPDGSTLYEVQSTDDGATWSLPQAVGQGSMQAMQVDHTGTFHALALGPKPFDSQLHYGTVGGDGAWTWTPISAASREHRADLALLEQGGQIVRMVITTREASADLPRPHLRIFRSDDGQTWNESSQPAFADGEIANPTIRPRIIAVPRGEGLIAVAWSNYGSGRVLARVSSDGGQSFGPSEIIAQHRTDGEITTETDYGVEPSLAYDAEADALLATWVEIETGAGETYPWPLRSYVARRPLDAPVGAAWVNAVTPDTEADPRFPLDSQRRVYLFATPDGQHAGVVAIDERNYQWRLHYRGVRLSVLTQEAVS